MELGLVIASKGRKECFSYLIESIAHQNVRPAHVVLSVTCEEDLPHDIKEICEKSNLNITIATGSIGASVQRNVGIRMLKEQVDIISFIDDDFLMDSDWVKNCCAAFEKYPDIAGLTGYVVKDGAVTGSCSWEEAAQLLSAHDDKEKSLDDYIEAGHTYGCNMAFRTQAMGDEVFDEKLPLYSWLEDRDFSLRVGRQGRIIKSMALHGVHLSVSSGRTSGVRFGYSQVANPYYLYQKDVLSFSEALKLLGRCLLKNLYKSILPEPTIDRRGRMKGNFIAVKDIVLRKSDPERILSLT